MSNIYTVYVDDFEASWPIGHYSTRELAEDRMKRYKLRYQEQGLSITTTELDIDIEPTLTDEQQVKEYLDFGIEPPKGLLDHIEKSRISHE